MQKIINKEKLFMQQIINKELEAIELNVTVTLQGKQLIEALFKCAKTAGYNNINSYISNFIWNEWDSGKFN